MFSSGVASDLDQAFSSSSQKASSGSNVYWNQSISYGILTDARDKKSYRTTQIGSQNWMAENLNFTAIIGESRCYNAKTTNCSKYGLLYDWEAATASCPDGWHLPDSSEWSQLAKHLGGLSAAGKILKASTSLWKTNTGNDAFGFSALPSGNFDTDQYYDLGTEGFWWTSSQLNNTAAVYLDLVGNNNELGAGSENKVVGLAVRCIQDLEIPESSSAVQTSSVARSSLTPSSNRLSSSVTRSSSSSITYGSLVDSRESPSKSYRTIKIGTLTWMAENLNYGTTTGSWCYGGQEANCATDGRLYSWDTATTVCPEGWVLPTDEDATYLSDFAGGLSVAGKILKAEYAWNTAGAGSNTLGFSMLPAGYYENGTYANRGGYGDFWTLSVAPNGDAWNRHFDATNGIQRSSYHKVAGLSVRCIKLEPLQTGTFQDQRDLKQYKTVVIGKQTWMAENLNFKTTTGSWCYNGLEANCTTDGRLYDWATAKTSCPSQWHLPTDTEYSTLTNLIGGLGTAGQDLKSTKTWLDSAAGTDRWGFSALPTGYAENGTYANRGGYGDLWTSTFYNDANAWNRHFDETGSLTRGYYHKVAGLSVRCVKD